MTKEQMMQAINAGIDVVKNLKDKTDIIGLGEMGIGNTTTTSAVASVLLGIPVEKSYRQRCWAYKCWFRKKSKRNQKKQ